MRFRRKLLMLYIAFGVALGVIWLRSLELQWLEGDRWEKTARNQRLQTERLEALRGPILAADGYVLAEDVPVFQLAVVGWEWTHRERTVCTGCGLVHFPRASGRPRRYCPCGVGPPGKGSGEGRMERLPPGSLAPLEEALELERGELARRADARVAAIDELVADYERRLRSQPSYFEFLIDDKVKLRRRDLMLRPFVVASDVPEGAVRLVETDERGRFRGFRIQTALRRRYPLGDFAPQLLGFTSVIKSAEEKQRLEEHHPDQITWQSRVGRRGLERAYDWSLRGTPGERVLGLEARGGFSRVEADRPPLPGRPLVLSLHAGVSREAEKILAQHATPEGYLPSGVPSGGFVMIDAETGEVLVWAELPRFDLNTGLDRIFDRRLVEAKPIRKARIWEPRHPLAEGMDLETWRTSLVVPVPVAMSRVAQVAVEPGSTFKPLIALGLLESGKPLQYEWFTCRKGSPGKPHCHGCGEVDLVLAITKSCNRYFAWSLRDAKHWPTYRHAVADFVSGLGLGRKPGHEIREWSAGQWLWPWFDFRLEDAVTRAQARLREDLGEGALTLRLSSSPRTPETIGGDPDRLARLLAQTATRIARLSRCRAVGVHVHCHAVDGSRVTLDFGLRALGKAAWCVLPEPKNDLAALPPALRGRAPARAGVTGVVARGGTVWFRATFDRRLNRDGPEQSLVIRADDGRNVAIGQGPVLATPLQMARAMAVIANGGTLVEPHVAKYVGGVPRPCVTKSVPIHPSHLELVRRGMFGCVNDRAAGTARRQAWHLVPADVYGKTGTSQVGGTWRPFDVDAEDGGPWHHWFVGFSVAAGRRTVAFACVLHSRLEAAAGLTSAGAVQEILTRWYAAQGSD